MLTTIASCAVIGIDGAPVAVEVDVSPGFPKFIMVGLPDKSVDESRQRIPTAIKNAGFEYPFTKRIVVNLAPADVRKEGAAFDMPIALGILVAHGIVPRLSKKAVYIGELALDGTFRTTRGILPITMWAQRHGFEQIFVPASNAEEAALVSGIAVIPIPSLQKLVLHLVGKVPIPSQKQTILAATTPRVLDIDMQHISGQEHAKRAFEIAAAGSHNIFLSGPPGSGKTLLARSLASILPPLSQEEQLEVTKIYSIADRLHVHEPLMRDRPFRSPHHTSSGAALVGGGTIPRPGEISLAHRGVLFLDEFPEFSRQVLENLRQPLEDGVVTVARAHASIKFPARFLLVASQNPCPCGYWGDTERACTCSQQMVLRYKGKVSGPILDRIDIHITVPRVPIEDLATLPKGEPSAVIRERVIQARVVQSKRFSNCAIITNSEMPPALVRANCSLPKDAADLLHRAARTLHVSARAYHRILKIARTIADLAGVDTIQAPHIAEALQYRTNE